jgi:hypothetical protein
VNISSQLTIKSLQSSSVHLINMFTMAEAAARIGVASSPEDLTPHDDRDILHLTRRPQWKARFQKAAEAAKLWLLFTGEEVIKQRPDRAQYEEQAQKAERFLWQQRESSPAIQFKQHEAVVTLSQTSSLLTFRRSRDGTL